MTVSYYGCTASHPEFTCLTASYVAGKKWKNEANWCDNCRTKYGAKEE